MCKTHWLFSLLDTGSSCIDDQEFLSEQAVRSRALMVNQITPRDFTQRIFPDIHFSCSGLLTKWIIGGQPRNPMKPLPELQIWRTVNGKSYYKKSFSLISTLPNTTSDGNVYEYIVNPPLEFQEGDVFGLYKPSEKGSVLNILLQENSGPLAYGLEEGATESLAKILVDPTTLLDQNDYPMVSVEVSIKSKWQKS